MQQQKRIDKIGEELKKNREVFTRNSQQERQRLKAIEYNVKGLKKSAEKTTKARKSHKGVSKGRKRRKGLNNKINW
jgi:hypothetical protein